jgi:hypothetical protein
LLRSDVELIDRRRVGAFRRGGFVVVPGLFQSAEMERISRWVDELETAPELPGRHWMYFEVSQSRPGERLLNRIENFAPFHPELSALLQGEPLVGAVSALLGEPAVLFKDKINFKLPGGGGFEAHQDAQAGWNSYASLFVTVAVAIDRATRENGCLELGHWKHRLELIGELWSPLPAASLQAVEFVPYPMEPGDVAFFDSYLPHRSAPNGTEDRRRVLYITYNRASEGDQRASYYADKHANYPPDCERDPGKAYAYRV